MQKPLGPKDEYCPLWRRAMVKVCHKCPWWLNIKGQHPQTGEAIDQWNCAVALSVVATLEAAQQARQGAAATESFRNEVVARAARQGAALQRPYVEQGRLAGGQPKQLQ